MAVGSAIAFLFYVSGFFFVEEIEGEIDLGKLKLTVCLSIFQMSLSLALALALFLSLSLANFYVLN